MAQNRKRRGRGEGGIYQFPDGRWSANLSLGYDSNGKRRRKVVYGDTKQEVVDKLKALDPSIIRATKGKLSLGQWLDAWHELRKGTVADSTRWRDGKTIEKVKPLIGRLPLSAIDTIVIERFYRQLEEKGESVDCVRRCGIMLGTAFKAAIARKVAAYNPVRDVAKPRQDRKDVEVASKDEIKELLKAAKDSRHYALFVLACCSGMRQGELFGLLWQHVDLDAAAVHVVHSLMEVDGKVTLKDCKTKKSKRTIALPPMAVEALREHRKKMLAEGNITGPVFCAVDGGWLYKSNFYHRVWFPIRQAAGLTVKFHSLRHSHATLLLANGTDAKTVSERMGHSTVAFTLDTYTKVTSDQQKAAAKNIGSLLG
jgi:integrase